MSEASPVAVRSDQPDGVVEDSKGNVVIGAPTATAIVVPTTDEEENE